MKRFSAHIGILLFCALLPGALMAQVPKGFSGKRFSLPWQDPETSELKAMLTGQNARQVTGSQVLVSDFQMQVFRGGKTNQIELTAEGPECLVDTQNRTGSSSKKVSAYSANTNLFIEGTGFSVEQTNAVLVISNDVRTIIRKEFLQSQAGRNRNDVSASITNGGTGGVLNVNSDRVVFLYESNLVSYSGNVRVEDEQMQLTSDVLSIQFSTNKTLQQITAGDRVVIVSKSDNSRATGKRAIYSIHGTNETISLTGHPTWSDGEQEGKADVFTFDRTTGTFRAETNAVFTISSDKIGTPEILETASDDAKKGKPVEISADLISFTRPQTNAPGRRMIAENNVVISSEGNQSRATADKAIYDEQTGRIELTGKPVWNVRGSQIAAEILVLERTNQFFGARTNVRVKIPATMFGKILGATNTTLTQTNPPVEIVSKTFSFVTNVATFEGNVRASAVDPQNTKSTLDAAQLEIGFGKSNQVKTLIARQNVVLAQIPGESAHSDVLKRSVASEILTLNRSEATGWVESIQALTNVVGLQIKALTNGETAQRLSADSVTINYLPGTNRIGKVIAVGNVFAEKIDFLKDKEQSAQAHGAHGIYDSARDSIELTGEPTARIESRFIHDVKVFRWDLKTGKISANPYRFTPTNPTNDLRVLIRELQP